MTALATLMLLMPQPASAQSPTGGSVVAGSAAISQSGLVTNINQSSSKAIINWQGFSVGAQNTVNFHQPGASSVALNRVIGNESSVIDGALNANGQVFIVNSNGVLFGKGAQVNVGGLVASTHDISNSDFMAGNYTFSGTSNAAVINRGRVRAHGGGYVALLGKTVSNEGVIAARLGTVAMSAGEKLTLNFEGNSLLDVTIDKGALNALVANKRAIRADGGRVILTAKAADQVLSAQVNNTGIVQARTVAALKGGSASGKVRIGNIKIYAYGGKANISGKLDASAPVVGDGGFIETSGDKVTIADDAVVTTKSATGTNGLWLIDPTDFNIVAGTGGQTESGIGAETLSSNLENGDIAIATVATGGEDGNINVNAGVEWWADTSLTLTAHNDININAPLTAHGTNAGLVLDAAADVNINNAVTLHGANAALAMTFGGDYNIRTRASYSGVADEPGPVTDKDGNPVYDGNGDQAIGPVAKQDTSGGVYGSVTFSSCVDTASCGTRLKINNTDYTLIGNIDQLATTGVLNGNYALGRDLDAGSSVYSTAVIGTLTGTLAGLGHVISGLTIDAPNSRYVGLIGQADPGSVVRDIGLIDANIKVSNSTGNAGVGALIGYARSTVQNAYSDGSQSNITLTTPGYTGGLIGWAVGATVSDSYSTISGVVGGLVGRAQGGGSIIRTHATGDIEDRGLTSGGLAGYVQGTYIGDSYATGDVTGSANSTQLGGLVGSYNAHSSGNASGNAIRNSFATGNVTGGRELGGLIGSFDTGTATVTQSPDISNSYATGNVTSMLRDRVSASTALGGFIGKIDGSTRPLHISDSFASGDVRSDAPDTSEVEGIGGFIGAISSPSSTYGNSTITNSYSTGDVHAPGAVYVGGFVGRSSRADYASVYASGNVTGHAVGGFAGLMSRGALTDSYVSGSVTSVASTYWRGESGGYYSGGLVGQGTQLNVTNSYYNADGFSGNINGVLGNSEFYVWDPVDATGLTSDQIADAKYYADGTINQVLADRAAAAAQAVFEANAAQTGASLMSNPETSSSPPPTAASLAAMQSAAKLDAVDDSLKGTEQQVRDDDERRERERRAAQRRAASQGQGGSGAGFGATIRSIDVDGQRFDLENTGPNSGGNDSSAPAPGGGGQ